jgi:hypothetical protein
MSAAMLLPARSSFYSMVFVSRASASACAPSVPMLLSSSRRNVSPTLAPRPSASARAPSAPRALLPSQRSRRLVGAQGLSEYPCASADVVQMLRRRYFG